MDGALLPLASSTGLTDRMRAHRPVMLDEALTGLGVAARPKGLFVDGTFGRGGHSSAILKLLKGGTLHAFDQDPDAEAHARREFADRSGFHFHAGNFATMAEVAKAEGFLGKADGVLLDLGVSSPQFDVAERGFSFSADGPLDMRMNPRTGQSAAEWLAKAKEEEIADVLFLYGEERNSRRIAKRLVEARAETPITRTAQLAALIASVPGPRSHKIHPATRSFQAIRIHVNGELDVLNTVLEASLDVLAPGGRLAVISFHSLEDRIVKQFIRDNAGPRQARDKYEHLKAGKAAPAVPLRELERVFPSSAECEENPRARSAVLRVAERLGGRS